MSDRKTIYLDDAIDAICKACSMEEDYHKCDGYPETSTWCDNLVALRALPSAQPDFSCDGCKTPKHICGICMRNYPNITDHYCTGEWAERREE